MYIQFVKDEEGNCIVEYAYNEYEATEGMTHMYDWEIDGRIPDLLEEHKLYALERNGEMVDGCLGFKSVAQHVGNNKIFGILRKEGEYHDEENNLHLRIVHPVAVRNIVADNQLENDEWANGDSDDLDAWNGKEDVEEGWEGTWKVIGIEPERDLREAVVNSMVDNGYVDSCDKVVAIDDWHYQVTGEILLWDKKEDLIAKKINEALKKAGWNVAVSVQLKANDDASFVIDITNHTFGTYYALVQYDSHYSEFERDVPVSRNPDEFYLQIIRKIFLTEEEREARVEAIESLLASGRCYGDDIIKFRPRLLLRDGYIVADNLYDVFAFHEDIKYIDMPGLEKAKDPDEARDEFMEDLYANWENVFHLNIE